MFGATADAHFKRNGFSALVDYHFRKVDPHGSGISDFDAQGVVIQVGYSILPQRLEVASRHSWLDPTDESQSNNKQEYGTALGFFFSSHNLKVQAELRNVDTERPTKRDKHEIEVRVQVQAIF